MYSNKASKGRVDQEYAKIGFKTVSLLNFFTLHDIAYFPPPPFRDHILLPVSDSLPWNPFPLLSGGYFSLKDDLKMQSDLGNIFSWPKYGNAPAAASRAVMLCDMAFGLQFNYEKWWEAFKMKALTQLYKMRIRITGLKYKTRGMSGWAQIKSVSNGEKVKEKLNCYW